MRNLTILTLAVIFAFAATVNAANEAGQRVDPIQVVDLGLSIEEGSKAPVISGLALGTSGENWATCGDDHLVRIWDASKGAVLKKFAGHADWVRAVVFFF